ncbi:glycine--tRNA ligase [archaeon]|jgi:glycyl-tRNA synthetase|nr:glycine--tRNA ligase [archaeon]MBT4417123.1 glycine--tRNA ligase [archaeon]
MDKLDKINSITLSRGFFYPSAEIYKASSGFWTYGHLGTRIKHKWENIWRKSFLGLSPRYFEIDDCVIMPKKVFESSGHLEHFNDPLTECRKCHQRYRADQLVENATNKNAEDMTIEELDKAIEKNKIKCPKCKDDLSKIKIFNMMFPINVGATETNVMYLRPESAQSPYLAYKREFEAMRRKLPFGLATIGKVFRNEISPRQGFFRLREIVQAELQIFFDPKEITKCDNWDKIKSEKIRILKVGEKKIKDYTCAELLKQKIPKFYLYHMVRVQKFYVEDLQIPKQKFRFRELSEKERAFYNKIHFDMELDVDTLGGWKEFGGLHYRGDYDLTCHQKGSKQKMESVRIDGSRFIPHILELSFGVDRNVWALVDIFFKEGERDYIAFPLGIAPFDVAVFPLVNKKGLPEKAMEIFDSLRKEFNAFYDESGSVGRRYRRQDEVGTNFGVTIDFDTLEKGVVTIRDRDSMKQIRVDEGELVEVLRNLLGGLKFSKAGELVK